MKLLPSTMIGIVFSLATSQVAFAHAKLVAADPPMNGAARGRPQSLHLMFSEEISVRLSGATVKGAGGVAIPVSAKTERGGKGLVVMVKQPLKPGIYSVDWHAVASDDGHRTAGTYKFSVN